MHAIFKVLTCGGCNSGAIIDFVEDPVPLSVNTKDVLSDIIEKGTSNNQQGYRDAVDTVFAAGNEKFRKDFFNDPMVQYRLVGALLRQEGATKKEGASTQDCRILTQLIAPSCQCYLDTEQVTMLKKEFFSDGVLHHEKKLEPIGYYKQLAGKFGLTKALEIQIPRKKIQI